MYVCMYIYIYIYIYIYTPPFGSLARQQASGVPSSRVSSS